MDRRLLAKKAGVGLVAAGGLVVGVGLAAALAPSGVPSEQARTSPGAPVVLAQALKPLTPSADPSQSIESDPHGSGLSGRRTSAPPATPAAEAPRPEPRTTRDIRITAPHTDVRVDPNRGSVRVLAPYTFVDVDTSAGRATIRAPGVDLKLEW